MTDVRSAVDADPLTRDDLDEVREMVAQEFVGCVVTEVEVTVRRLLATVEQLRDAALDAATERDMQRAWMGLLHRDVLPRQDEYLALVLECARQGFEVPDAHVVTVAGAPRVELRVRRPGVTERGVYLGEMADEPGEWLIRGQRCPCAEAAVTLASTPVERA